MLRSPLNALSVLVITAPAPLQAQPMPVHPVHTHPVHTQPALTQTVPASPAQPAPTQPVQAQPLQARIVVQSSPLAGFRHYHAPKLWGEISPGDELQLKREPDNPHDRNAVRVEWRSLMLGYVPRAQNAAVARQLDHGTPLAARVSRVELTRAPNRRIEFEIYLPL